ncbi:MAG: sulfide dehydrogenase (flavocytochrome), flavoprotein subunit [Burkholderiales bacterium]|nr:sulfide dehydrogenase (flavocytochrome), flavoprotein subunit [Burkholderiales bacterium]
MKRRDFLKLAGAASLAGCATATPAKARVVVIGGGYGGATAAKYIRLWDPAINVVLSRGYDGLRRLGVTVVRDEATAVDAAKKTVRLASGGELAYERLVVSPGVDFMFGDVEGYERAMQAGAVLHAWKAGPQTVALRQKLEQMPDGGVYVLSIPLAPYRCPPGPYERVSMVAAYFKQAKPRAKVLVLDANPDVTSKGPLFKRAWNELYPGLIEYRGAAKVVAVGSGAVRTEFDTVRGDVLNVVPPHRAGDIAQKAGLIDTNNRWCDVDWRTMESKAIKGVHVLGDSTLSAPGMPKSGSMANNHAKIAAAAIVELLNGRSPQPLKIINTCYSFVSDKEAIRVSSVHQWEPGQGTLVPVKGSGGVSAARSEDEGKFAWNWARTIWADSLG